MNNKPVAVIKGASRGIGRSAAIALADEGYDIAAIARSIDSEGMEILAPEVEKRGSEFFPIGLDISCTGSNYFHDFSKNRVDLYGFMRLRIIKGLGLSVNGGIAYINDQINLSKGELSEAEVLLRLKQQATNFNFWGGVSLSYTFGSIYNNVVNPRFGNGGGENQDYY